MSLTRIRKVGFSHYNYTLPVCFAHLQGKDPPNRHIFEIQVLYHLSVLSRFLLGRLQSNDKFGTSPCQVLLIATDLVDMLRVSFDLSSQSAEFVADGVTLTNYSVQLFNQVGPFSVQLTQFRLETLVRVLGLFQLTRQTYSSKLFVC